MAKIIGNANENKVVDELKTDEIKTNEVKANEVNSEKPKRKRPKKQYNVNLNQSYDMFSVPEQCKDPDKVHFWPRRDPMRIQECLHRGALIEQGYEDINADPAKVVRTPDSLPPAPPEHILMYYPKDLADARQKAKEERAKEHEQEIADRTKMAMDIAKRFGRKGKAMLDDDDIDMSDEEAVRLKF